MSSGFRARTVESVVGIDEPEGVSWLSAFSLDMDPDYEVLKETPEIEFRYGSFPVTTAELLGKKGSALALGDIFSLELNLDAASPADVLPVIDCYEPPITDEEFRIILGEQ